MLLVFFLLICSISLFWYFDIKRKIRKAERQREKREAFLNLLLVLQKKDNQPSTDNTLNTTTNES